MFVSTLSTFGLREGDALGLKPDAPQKYNETATLGPGGNKRIPLHLARHQIHYGGQE